MDWVLSMILFFVPLLHFFEQFLTGAFFVILIEVPFLFYFLVKLNVCFDFSKDILSSWFISFIWLTLGFLHDIASREDDKDFGGRRLHYRPGVNTFKVN